VFLEDPFANALPPPVQPTVRSAVRVALRPAVRRLRRSLPHRHLKQARTFLNRVTGTVAILAQGTSWAVAVTQAFWPRFESHGMLDVPPMWLQQNLPLRVGACFIEGERELLYFCPTQSMRPTTYDL
jgi:hypothetical protein